MMLLSSASFAMVLLASSISTAPVEIEHTSPSQNNYYYQGNITLMVEASTRETFPVQGVVTFDAKKGACPGHLSLTAIYVEEVIAQKEGAATNHYCLDLNSGRVLATLTTTLGNRKPLTFEPTEQDQAKLCSYGLLLEKMANMGLGFQKDGDSAKSVSEYLTGAVKQWTNEHKTCDFKTAKNPFSTDS